MGTQEKVCSYVSEQLLPHALNGEHICILAYGQTGSGKTYTMFGDSAVQNQAREGPDGCRGARGWRSTP